MTLAGALLTPLASRAAAPEPLDPAFLDYLAANEGKEENWTVVADEKVRKKLPAPAEPKSPTPAKPAANQEKKP